ncbi:hypothetical protein [Methanorbis rubei]
MKERDKSTTGLCEAVEFRKYSGTAAPDSVFDALVELLFAVVCGLRIADCGLRIVVWKHVRNFCGKKMDVDLLIPGLPRENGMHGASRCQK